jgi:hypothetical protein
MRELDATEDDSLRAATSLDSAGTSVHVPDSTGNEVRSDIPPEIDDAGLDVPQDEAGQPMGGERIPLPDRDTPPNPDSLNAGGAEPPEGP